MLISSWQADEPISERRRLILQLQQGRGRRTETNRWRDGASNVSVSTHDDEDDDEDDGAPGPSVMFLISHSLSGVKSLLRFFFFFLPMRTRWMMTLYFNAWTLSSFCPESVHPRVSLTLSV